MEPAHQPWHGIFRREGSVFPEPVAAVVELVGLLSERGCLKVLDLGYGTGRQLVYLAQSGFRVCGLDSAPTGFRLTREWPAVAQRIATQGNW